jgi:hypothetical protein
MNKRDKLDYMKDLRNKLSDSITLDQYKNNLFNISSLRLSIDLNNFLEILYDFIGTPSSYLIDKCESSSEFLSEILEDNIKVFKLLISVLTIKQFKGIIDSPKVTSSFNIDSYIENFGEVLYNLFIKEIEDVGANIADDKLSICKIQIDKFSKNICNFIINNQFQNYKQELKKTNEWASDVMFGLLADYLNVDIYFININTKEVIPYDHVSKGNRPSIVVGWINQNHFENISINEDEGIRRLFEPTHPFIISIKEKIDQKKKRIDGGDIKELEKDKGVVKNEYAYNRFSKDVENPEEILPIIKKDPYYPSNTDPGYFVLSKAVPYYKPNEVFIKQKHIGNLPENTVIYYAVKYPGYKQDWKHPLDKKTYDIIYIYKDNSWHTQIMLENGWRDYIKSDSQKIKPSLPKNIDLGTWAEMSSGEPSFDKSIRFPSNFLDSNLTAYKMIYTAIDKDVMKKIFQESDSINSFKKLSILLQEQLQELNIDQYKINICLNRLKTLIKEFFKDREEQEEQERKKREEQEEQERREREEQEEQEREREEQEEQERKKREEQEEQERKKREEQEKRENVRQSKRPSKKRVPMTDEEKKERRKERYDNEKHKMKNDPAYAAYRDFRKGAFKHRSNDPEYIRKYQEEWTSHNKRSQSQYKDFFREPPPPFFSQPQKEFEKPNENEKEKEKEYQEDLKANKELLKSDKFRCVDPYNKGDDNIRNRLNSCKNVGNYKKGYSKFFDNKQQCIEYCNM